MDGFLTSNAYARLAKKVLTSKLDCDNCCSYLPRKMFALDCARSVGNLLLMLTPLLMGTSIGSDSKQKRNELLYNL